MEHVICKQIRCHLSRNSIISQHQHGYQRGLSCDTHEWASTLNIHGQVDVLFLDFAKAFDTVIPFLDILVKRCPNNTFVTSIYQKKTFTGLYTKWDSFTPRKYKINLIRTLTYRCFRICSSASLLQSALDDLRKLLLQNGYPQGIITYNVNDVLNKNRNKPNSPVSTVPKKDIIILLPYLGLESNQISKRLKSCVYNFYSFVNLRLIFQNTRRIKSFFPYKDRLNRSQQSKVIYKACCWDCDDFYIGKTDKATSS